MIQELPCGFTAETYAVSVGLTFKEDPGDYGETAEGLRDALGHREARNVVELWTPDLEPGWPTRRLGWLLTERQAWDLEGCASDDSDF